jgi:hypothetical protein
MSRHHDLTVAERHQLRIARDTLRMPDAMVGVMGGMDKETARHVIAVLGSRKRATRHRTKR